MSYHDMEMVEIFNYLSFYKSLNFNKLMKIADKLGRRAIFFEVTYVTKSFRLLKVLLSEQQKDYIRFAHEHSYATVALSTVRDISNGRDVVKLKMLAGKDGMYGPRSAYNFYYATYEMKLSFQINIMSLFLANDICNSMARENGLIDVLAEIIEKERDV